MDNAYEVVIAGAGPAGLEAALMLGRARRRVLLLDAGRPRNAPAREAHGFLTRDGVPPDEILRLGREQLAPYPSVSLWSAAVLEAIPDGDGFWVGLEGGRLVRTRKLLLATGVRDELPPIEGLAPLWGQGVFHCPYCHAWELKDEPLAVYGRDEAAFELALLLKGWSADLALVSDGQAALGAGARETLRRNGIPLYEAPLLRLDGGPEGLERIVFASGESLARRGLFLRTKTALRSEIPQRLGCRITDGGQVEVVDRFNQTAVPGLYVAGDVSNAVQSVLLAAAAGATAAIGINHALALEAAERAAV